MTTARQANQANKYYLPRIESIPYEIQKKLPRSALMLYQVLKDIHDRSHDPVTGKTRCMPSYRRLSQLISVSVQTIHVAIHRLKALGLIDHVHRWDPQTKRYRTNLYYVPKIIYKIIRTAWDKVRKCAFRVNTTLSRVVTTRIRIGKIADKQDDSAIYPLGKGDRLKPNPNLMPRWWHEALAKLNERQKK